MEQIYTEKQKLDSIWPLGILAAVSIFNYLLYFQFRRTNMDVFYSSMMSFTLLASLLSIMRLETTITRDVITYKFFPFHFKWKTINWADVSNVETRTYNPLTEYYGWGIKSSKTHGRSYSISGNQGIQFALKSGSKILIGTHKVDEVNEYIRTLNRKQMK